LSAREKRLEQKEAEAEKLLKQIREEHELYVTPSFVFLKEESIQKLNCHNNLCISLPWTYLGLPKMCSTPLNCKMKWRT
jgi:hypothetical protein